MIYKPTGVCSKQIDIELDGDVISFDVVDNKVTNVRFLGGCSGNTQGVA